MEFKQIYSQIKKAIKSPPYTYEEANRFLNMGIDELSRWCFIPNCGKKFKNHKGVMIHVAKFHRFSKKNIIDKSMTLLVTK